MELFSTKMKIESDVAKFCQVSKTEDSYEILWVTEDLIDEGDEEMELSSNLSREEMLDICFDLIDQGWEEYFGLETWEF